jgi:hypothetical protein
MIKIAIMCLILMFLNACQSEPVNCCPIASGRIEQPKTVREYIANDEIFKSYLDKCKCNL